MKDKTFLYPVFYPFRSIKPLSDCQLKIFTYCLERSTPPPPQQKNCPTHLWIAPTLLYDNFKSTPRCKLLQVPKIWELRYGTIHCFLLPPVLLGKPLCQAIHLTPRLNQLPISLLTREQTSFKVYLLQESYS